MSEKKIKMEQFAPNGFLTSNQVERLKRWIDGERRTIKLVDLASELDIARMSINNAFKKNPERPFDEFKLGTVNKLIAVFNEDLKKSNPKEETKKEQKNATKKEKERAKKLIKKVDA